jgi:sugar O-acyltransferase (sialic acid O-acetyltransferase NeuD family)
MATKLLIVGKGDSIITMILDNLYSNNNILDVDIYNNLNLPTLNDFNHDNFNIKVLDEVNLEEYTQMILGVYQPNYKVEIVKSLKLNTDKFINILHNDVNISKMGKGGKGILLNSNASIAAHTSIGNFVNINRHVSIGHHTTIGDYCSINPGSNIAGNVTIGERSLIGMGVNIIDGIRIGDNTVIGAGSLVVKDIPNNVVAYGNPCKVIRDNVNN